MKHTDYVFHANFLAHTVRYKNGIFFMFLKEISYAHQGCIMCIMLLQFKITVFYFSINVIYFCDGKPEFLASLLQS